MVETKNPPQQNQIGQKVILDAGHSATITDKLPDGTLVGTIGNNPPAQTKVCFRPENIKTVG